MKTKNITPDLLDEEFEYTGVIEEVVKGPVRVANIWANTKNHFLTVYPKLTVKKFNKEEIKALEEKMKKEGKI